MFWTSTQPKKCILYITAMIAMRSVIYYTMEFGLQLKLIIKFGYNLSKKFRCLNEVQCRNSFISLLDFAIFRDTNSLWYWVLFVFRISLIFSGKLVRQLCSSPKLYHTVVYGIQAIILLWIFCQLNKIIEYIVL